MNATEILEKIGLSLGSAGTVKSVFGEPIHAEGRIVVPIAKIAFGFGGGSGAGPDRRGENAGKFGEGGGGGGGVRAFPAGALEITATGTRFIPFTGLHLLAGAFLVGLVFGRVTRRSRQS
jgi:uncharacterized spore protein YtfJ